MSAADYGRESLIWRCLIDYLGHVYARQGQKVESVARLQLFTSRGLAVRGEA
jgi:hypothetical protein